MVPLRPGALAALTAADFDKRLGVLRIGKDKANSDRKIKLPQATAEFFAALAKNKLPGAPLLGRADGSAWSKATWVPAIREAATTAKLPSRGHQLHPAALDHHGSDRRRSGCPAGGSR